MLRNTEAEALELGDTIKLHSILEDVVLFLLKAHALHESKTGEVQRLVANEFPDMFPSRNRVEATLLADFEDSNSKLVAETCNCIDRKNTIWMPVFESLLSNSVQDLNLSIYSFRTCENWLVQEDDENSILRQSSNSLKAIIPIAKSPQVIAVLLVHNFQGIPQDVLEYICGHLGHVMTRIKSESRADESESALQRIQMDLGKLELSLKDKYDDLQYGIHALETFSSAELIGDDIEDQMKSQFANMGDWIGFESSAPANYQFFLCIENKQTDKLPSCICIAWLHPPSDFRVALTQVLGGQIVLNAARLLDKKILVRQVSQLDSKVTRLDFDLAANFEKLNIANLEQNKHEMFVSILETFLIGNNDAAILELLESEKMKELFQANRISYSSSSSSHFPDKYTICQELQLSQGHSAFLFIIRENEIFKQSDYAMVKVFSKVASSKLSAIENVATLKSQLNVMAKDLKAGEETSRLATLEYKVLESMHLQTYRALTCDKSQINFLFRTTVIDTIGTMLSAISGAPDLKIEVFFSDEDGFCSINNEYSSRKINDTARVPLYLHKDSYSQQVLNFPFLMSECLLYIPFWTTNVLKGFAEVQCDTSQVLYTSQVVSIVSSHARYLSHLLLNFSSIYKLKMEFECSEQRLTETTDAISQNQSLEYSNTESLEAFFSSLLVSRSVAQIELLLDKYGMHLLEDMTIQGKDVNLHFLKLVNYVVPLAVEIDLVTKELVENLNLNAEASKNSLRIESFSNKCSLFERLFRTVCNDLMPVQSFEQIDLDGLVSYVLGRPFRVVVFDGKEQSGNVPFVVDKARKEKTTINRRGMVGLVLKDIILQVEDPDSPLITDEEEYTLEIFAKVLQQVLDSHAVTQVNNISMANLQSELKVTENQLILCKAKLENWNQMDLAHLKNFHVCNSVSDLVKQWKKWILKLNEINDLDFCPIEDIAMNSFASRAVQLKTVLSDDSVTYSCVFDLFDEEIIGVATISTAVECSESLVSFALHQLASHLSLLKRRQHNEIQNAILQGEMDKAISSTRKSEFNYKTLATQFSSLAKWLEAETDLEEFIRISLNAGFARQASCVSLETSGFYNQPVPQHIRQYILECFPTIAAIESAAVAVSCDCTLLVVNKIDQEFTSGDMVFLQTLASLAEKQRFVQRLADKRVDEAVELETIKTKTLSVQLEWEQQRVAFLQNLLLVGQEMLLSFNILNLEILLSRLLGASGCRIFKHHGNKLNTHDSKDGILDTSGIVGRCYTTNSVINIPCDDIDDDSLHVLPKPLHSVLCLPLTMSLGVLVFSNVSSIPDSVDLGQLSSLIGNAVSASLQRQRCDEKHQLETESLNEVKLELESLQACIETKNQSLLFMNEELQQEKEFVDSLGRCTTLVGTTTQDCESQVMTLFSNHMSKFVKAYVACRLWRMDAVPTEVYVSSPRPKLSPSMASLLGEAKSVLWIPDVGAWMNSYAIPNDAPLVVSAYSFAVKDKGKVVYVLWVEVDEQSSVIEPCCTGIGSVLNLLGVRHQERALLVKLADDKERCFENELMLAKKVESTTKRVSELLNTQLVVENLLNFSKLSVESVVGGSASYLEVISDRLSGVFSIENKAVSISIFRCQGDIRTLSPSGYHVVFDSKCVSMVPPCKISNYVIHTGQSVKSASRLTTPLFDKNGEMVGVCDLQFRGEQNEDVASSFLSEIIGASLGAARICDIHQEKVDLLNSELSRVNQVNKAALQEAERQQRLFFQDVSFFEKVNVTDWEDGISLLVSESFGTTVVFSVNPLKISGRTVFKTPVGWFEFQKKPLDQDFCQKYFCFLSSILMIIKEGHSGRTRMEEIAIKVQSIESENLECNQVIEAMEVDNVTNNWLLRLHAAHSIDEFLSIVTNWFSDGGSESILKTNLTPEEFSAINNGLGVYRSRFNFVLFNEGGSPSALVSMPSYTKSFEKVKSHFETVWTRLHFHKSLSKQAIHHTEKKKEWKREKIEFAEREAGISKKSGCEDLLWRCISDASSKPVDEKTFAVLLRNVIHLSEKILSAEKIGVAVIDQGVWKVLCANGTLAKVTDHDHPLMSAIIHSTKPNYLQNIKGIPMNIFMGEQLKHAMVLPCHGVVLYAINFRTNEGNIVGPFPEDSHRSLEKVQNCTELILTRHQEYLQQQLQIVEHGNQISELRNEAERFRKLILVSRGEKEMLSAQCGKLQRESDAHTNAQTNGYIEKCKLLEESLESSKRQLHRERKNYKELEHKIATLEDSNRMWKTRCDELASRMKTVELAAREVAYATKETQRDMAAKELGFQAKLESNSALLLNHETHTKHLIEKTVAKHKHKESIWNQDKQEMQSRLQEMELQLSSMKGSLVSLDDEKNHLRHELALKDASDMYSVSTKYTTPRHDDEISLLCSSMRKSHKKRSSAIKQLFELERSDQKVKKKIDDAKKEKVIETVSWASISKEALHWRK